VQLTLGDVPSDQVDTDSLDSNVLNNRRTANIFQADAQISELNITNFTTGANGRVTYSGKMQNTGTLRINPGTYYYRAYLSSNGTIDANDVELGTGANGFQSRRIVIGGNGLLPNSRVSFSGTFNANIDTTARPFLILQVDADGVSTRNNLIPEAIEGNNAASARMQSADLELTSAIVNLVSGNSLTYTYTLKNNGPLPVNLATAGLNIQALLSADNVFNNTGDVSLGNRPLGTSLPVLQPGVTFSRRVTHTASSAIDLSTRKNLGLKIDGANVITESNETNNTKFFDATRPDLSIASVKATRVDNNLFDYEFTILNNSAVVVDLNGPTGLFNDNVQYRVLLSKDTVFGNADDDGVSLALRDFPERLRLQPGQSYVVQGSATQDTTGYTHIGARIDSASSITEASEGNNTKFALLRQGDLGFSPPILFNITPVSGRNSIISFSYSFRNSGTAALDLSGATNDLTDNVVVKAYLSTDPIFSASGDQLIFTRTLGGPTPSPLNPGDSFSRTESEEVLATDLAARPYLILQIDSTNKAAESVETNNTIVTDTRALPDLVVSTAKVQAVSNTSITYQVTIQNNGRIFYDLRGADGNAATTADNLKIRGYGSVDQSVDGSTDINWSIRVCHGFGKIMAGGTCGCKTRNCTSTFWGWRPPGPSPVWR
jgi:hypothetical protein